MGLAIELGQRGISVTVIERHPHPQPVPRGQNLTQRTMEHLHAWGVDQEIRAARPIPREESLGGVVAYRELLGKYSYEWLRRSLVGDYYAQKNERLPQYDTENTLRRRVAELKNVTVRYGWDVVGARQDEQSVVVDIQEHRGTARDQLRALYVVGCDGSKSVVRRDAGLEVKTLSTHHKWMVLVVFRSQELHRKLTETYPHKVFFCVLRPELEGYWSFFGRVDRDGEFFFHAPVPEEEMIDGKPSMDVSGGADADVRTAGFLDPHIVEAFDFPDFLQRSAGAKFDVDVRHTGLWDLRFVVARRYGNGRMFIAGDAAHSHPPYGGYGVNTGFEDARNLGWKLAAVLQGWGSAGLLDSYSAERQPVFQSTAADFIAKAIDTDRAFLETWDPAVDRQAFEQHWAQRREGAKGEVDAFEPNYEGSPIVVDDTAAPDRRPSAKGRHAFAARPGHHLAPIPLESGESVYERLGAGLTLLAFDADEPVIAAFAKQAKERRIPLTVVRAPATAETGQYAASLILVRPDHFVAWVGGSMVRLNVGAVLRTIVASSA